MKTLSEPACTRAPRATGAGLLATLALLLALGSVGAALAGYPLEFIELKHRPLDEILPLVTPFAGADGTVSGETVTLEISTGQRKPRGYPRTIQLQETSTRVRGRLGEWIQLGVSASPPTLSTRES